MKKYLLLVAVVFAFFGCTKEAADNGANAAAAGTGTGGSLARFTIVGNYLYVADYARLQTFDISDPSKLVQVNDRTLGFDIETLFPYKDKLFVGAATGMYLLSLADPAKPLLLGSVAHLRSCDPVVANDSVAFVTLRGSGRCGAATDGLYVYTFNNLLSPVQLNLTELPSPNGLGLKDSILYVCQQNYGMSIFNVNNPASPRLRKKLTDYKFQDVIPYNDLLLCYVENGLAIYDITTPASPVFITEIVN